LPGKEYYLAFKMGETPSSFNNPGSSQNSTYSIIRTKKNGINTITKPGDSQNSTYSIIKIGYIPSSGGLLSNRSLPKVFHKSAKFSMAGGPGESFMNWVM